MVILAGDHVYKMDYEPDAAAARRVRRRRDRRLPRGAAHGGHRLRRHACRRARPDRLVPGEAQGPAGHPGQARAWRWPAWASTSSAPRFLFDQLRRDAADPSSAHDFGKNIIPYLVKHGKAVAHRFDQSCVKSDGEAEAYWRDVGTVDAYWEANIDLTSFMPALDLYDQSWPIWTYGEITPPAKFVHDEEGRRGQAVNSLVSGGCIVSGAGLRDSLLFTGVRVHSYAALEGAVVPALCRDRPPCPAQERGHRPRREDPREAGRRRGSRSSTPSASAAPTRVSCLITQPMIDRLGG